MFPKAQYPLTETQLSNAIAQRFDSAVVDTENGVVGFANFYRVETGGVCCIGNVVVAREARGNGVATFIVDTMTALAFDRMTPQRCRSLASMKIQQACYFIRN